MTNNKVCRTCGNPKISTFWSLYVRWGKYHYFSLSCQARDNRYLYLSFLIFTVILSVLWFLPIIIFNHGNFSTNLIWMSAVMIGIVLIFLVHAIYGFSSIDF